jgi:hypothetical protein
MFKVGSIEDEGIKYSWKIKTLTNVAVKIANKTVNKVFVMFLIIF